MGFQYIRIFRLNRVRYELGTAFPAAGKVSDIANRFGFWHMGQFAKDYKYFFGELPSATLKKSCGVQLLKFSIMSVLSE